MSLINHKYNYQELNRITEASGFRVYETPDGNALPSVTTILSAVKDMSFIDSWRKRIGNAEADHITQLSSNIGSNMHDNLEHWLRGEELIPGTAYVKKTGRALAEVIINQGLINVNEVWGLEEHLYYPGLYAGTADVLGMWKGEDSIIDFKNTRKPKRESDIEHYFLQLTAYAIAHNHLFGTNIKQGVILMVSREDSHFGEYQQFEIDIRDYTKKWFDAVEEYYDNDK
jgi:CRISPR/Cas system-associated exonuclease Cas4 (RecB family)